MRTAARLPMYLGALIAAITLAVAWDSNTVAAQQRAATPAAGKAPRTAWGAPDLQGVWNTNTAVPLERPSEYGTRAMMTEA